MPHVARTILAWISVCVICVAGCGCAGAWPQREGIIRPDGVHVIHVPGIMGGLGHDRELAYGLLLGGVEDVDVFEWTDVMPMRNLTDVEYQQKKGEELAARIRQHRALNPEARLVLTAHSGGGIVVIRALESLDMPDDSESTSTTAAAIVEQVWLLGVAVSPSYDLGRVMARTDRLVSVSSHHDWVILGLGTSLFGTSDRQHRDSAGMIGFAYDHPRFEQWGYDRSWSKFGNNGDHLRLLDHRFARSVIARSMLRWAPTRPLIVP